MDDEKIGKRIKEIRISKDFTQKQLAELSKIDATSISRYETGAQIPNLNTLVLIATALETSLDYLVFGTKTEFKLQKMTKDNIEEKILESISILLDNNVIIYDEESGGQYCEISTFHSAYSEFIAKYNTLKQLNGLIGDGYNNAKQSLIKSFAEQLKYDDQLPF